MNPRLAKQILYGTGYFIVFAGILTWAYFLWFKPAPSCFDNKQNQNETGVDCGGPCIPCALKRVVLPKTDWIKYFPVGSQTLIVAQIQNPNLDYGANRMTYVLNIYGNDGSPLKSVTRDSLIYAGEIKYILEPVDLDSQSIGDSKIDFSGFFWQPKDDFPTPTIQTRAIKTEATSGASGPTVNGFITNQNPFGLSRARIIGFLYNSTGSEIAVSKTELDNINAFEEMAFQISFPKNISIISNASSSEKSGAQIFSSAADPVKTKVYVEAIR